jgi:molybdopterin/thiamine biosynthesis adenylyltransferase
MTMFSYNDAFARNIGWISEAEQARMRASRVAVAGLGGVGGSHVLTLSRLGVGAFNLSDLDTFELANFNRQAGATVSHLHRPKLAVLTEMAQDINPEIDVRPFPDGINAENVDAFLDDVDLYVDALDFFALEARQLVFAACHARGIPAITAAPLGMGVAFLAFLPGKMSFEAYFRMRGHDRAEQAARLLLGLSPRMLQMPYLLDDGSVDFRAGKNPSTSMGCELCAGMAGTQALKVLTGRGKVPAAPWGLHFDAYRNKLVRTWRPGGNANPIQQLGLMLARRRLSAVMKR